jgi:UDP-MurNAc hydroxylase|tara:strand:+ start:4640 stop:6136 length:1497 start_codon:yes stop_codon:yes gene_type:complete
MNITTLGHAGLWIETKDLKVLCDPWHFKNPAFFNTWHVYPDNSNVDWDHILEKTDIVFVSHVHKDHFDEKILTDLLEKNNDVKVLLPDFRFCELKKDFEKIGYKNFIIKEYKKGDTTIVTYPSETIDREREDSSICVNDGSKTFLNFNDSTITPEHKDNIIKRFKKIDWAAGQFSGANWWPSCYEYNEDKKLELILSYKKRKIDHYKRMIDYLGVKKMIPIAGPPCFLQNNLNELNYRENKKSIFFDNWDVPEFNLMKQVYRTLPGDRYTFSSIKDIKDRPFDKEEFIKNNLYDFNYDVSNDEIKKIDKKIFSLFSDLLSNNTWLSKYIKCKIYLNVENYKTFCLDFKNAKVSTEDEIIKKGIYYIINFKQKVIYDLLFKNITDWEEAFLSCTCTFERKPDLYNPWILSFFRNLNNDRLQKIYEITQSSEVLEGKMIVGDYEVNRYCPHQQYDLMYHSKIDLENGTIQCLGHGWKWDLETCEGINCAAKIICNRIIRK